jgi:hypothetical protein
MIPFVWNVQHIADKTKITEIKRSRVIDSTLHQTKSILFPLFKGLILTSFVFNSSMVMAKDLAIDPATHDFGYINLDRSSMEQVFTVANESESMLQLGMIDALGNVTTTIDDTGHVSTAYSGEFTVTENACLSPDGPLALSPTDTCHLAMVFKPKSVGHKTFKVFVPYQDAFGNPTSVALPVAGIGASQPMPNIGASLMMHDFGEIPVGQSSPRQTIQVFNAGKGILKLEAVTFSETQEFELSDDCSNRTLWPQRSCRLQVVFKPQTAGMKTASISVPSTDPDTSILNITLQGDSFVPIPNIQVETTALNFGEIQVNSHSDYQNVIISNTGEGTLHLGEVGLVNQTEEVFTTLIDSCSHKTLGPASHCYMNIRFQPPSIGTHTGTFAIASDDPDTPMIEVALNGQGVGWCQGNYQQGFYSYPSPPNFGTEIVGRSFSLRQYVSTWARGCGALQIASITVTGTHATEFAIENQHCYNGSYQDTSYSNCQFSTIFSPTSAGTKSVELNVVFNDSSTKTVPLTADALDQGQANIDVWPTQHDFGTVVINRGPYSQSFTVKNTGNVNLQLGTIQLTGTHANEFQLNAWNCLYQPMLRPSETCQIYNTQFNPLSTGAKQAQLVIASNDTEIQSWNVALTGSAIETTDCSDADVTIETVEPEGPWAKLVYQNGQFLYGGATNTWQRLQNFQPGEVAIPNKPRQDDVVRIKSGHKVTGIPYAKIKTLCIEPGGRLESLTGDNIQSGIPLEIQATDYIENKGKIWGMGGTDEANGSACNQAQIGSGNCAYPGASVILKVATQIYNNHWWWWGNGGPILNEGEILAGHGGEGTQYSAKGGNTVVLGRNTNNKGSIIAGDGGDIKGTLSAQGGDGGLTEIWGKLGGYGHLYNINGAKAFAGDGGDCNPSANEPQIGGRGGNLRLMSAPGAYLNGGQHAAGQGGTQCAVNGHDGWVMIDPNIIDLSGAQTSIEGGNIAIYGGADWTLNLSNLQGTIVDATGDITLAVGEGGAIDLTGSEGKLLKTPGQVNIFADNILLEEGKTLSDVIEATNIVVGPAKILRDVSLVGPNQLIGQPGEKLSLRLTLTNGGPETDTYTLMVTDTAGWPLSQLPASLEIEGLQSAELELTITLPTTPSEKDTITVTAISQAEPETYAIFEIPVSVASQPLANASLDEGMLNLPGLETIVDGGEVTLYATEENDLIDLSNLGGNQVITATGEVTLAVPAGGTIDLRGNNQAVLETQGQVVIYIDDPANILLDPGVELADIIKAANIVIKPSKSQYGVNLTGPGELSKAAGSLLPITVTLENTGLTADTYTLNVTDTAGWPLSQLPNFKEVKGLDEIDLFLNVTLPQGVGQINEIIVTAISQTDANQAATATVKITTLAPKEDEPTDDNNLGGPSIDPSQCPLTGTINYSCRARGKIFTNVNFGKNASVSGGEISGNTENQGLLAQVTIQEGATLRGGKMSGHIVNNGTITDFTFVGASVRGGTIGGEVKNVSQVGGILIDVKLAANTTIEGGALAGNIEGNADSPAFLSNVRIKKGTRLSNVVLSDAIEIEGEVNFTETILLADDVHITGGEISGQLVGNERKPAVLTATTLMAGAQISYAIIGDNVQIAPDVSLGRGVRFSRRNVVPYQVELINTLPDLTTEPVADITYPKQANFNADIVEPSEGILAVINNLTDLTANEWELQQSPDWSHFELTIDDTSFAVLPVSVKRTNRSQGLHLGKDQSLLFSIETGLEVLTQPAVQAPQALQEALSTYDLPTLTVQTNGNLRIPAADNNWFSVRPDILAITIDSTGGNQLQIDTSPYGETLPAIAVEFVAEDGTSRQQQLYPGLAYPEEVQAQAKLLTVEPYGLVKFNWQGKTYQGIADYLVTQGSATSMTAFQVEPIADANGDGVADFQLTYSNGQQQVLFGLSTQ